MSIGLAAGWCKTLEQLKKAVQVPILSEITIGSYTWNDGERPGNPGTVYYDDPRGRFSLNSLGLPNRGIKYLLENINAMCALARSHQKRLRISIAGFSPEEYGLLTLALAPYADVLEINLGCPNVWGDDGKQKQIAAYNIELTHKILAEVSCKLAVSARGRPHTPPQIAIKVSPFEPFYLEAFATRIKTSWAHIVNEVVCCNTWPNGYASHADGRHCIDGVTGLAGVSGAAMLPIALGQTLQFCTLLPRTYEVVGCGGIEHGDDIAAFGRTGIAKVQIGTHAFENLRNLNDIAIQMA
jgi:dihydroorotate dehydrogenase (fumarate)